MTLYRATVNGPVALTSEEEAALTNEWNTNSNNIAIPHSVTIRQAKLALLDAGILAAVDLFVASQSEETIVYWENSLTIERDHFLVPVVQAGLGLTSTQIDALFISAASKT